MNGQIRLLLALLVLSLASFLDATYPKDQNEKLENEATREKKDPKKDDSVKDSATDPKPVIFPNQLDISSLRNMPLIILHPRTPINFEMLPGDNLESIHKSLNPSKILELLQSAAGNQPVKTPPPNREARNKDPPKRRPQPSVNRPVSVHFNSQQDEPALPRSLMNPNSNNGWFQRFRGTFSNMFQPMKPIREMPLNLGLPTFNLPVFFPPQGTLQASISPFPLDSLHQFQSLPWRNLNFHAPQVFHIGDLSTGASHLAPMRMMFGNPTLNGMRPPHISPHHFSGDLATSGSTFVPRRVPSFPYPAIPRFKAQLQRHKPLFNNVGGLQAASMEISNAFADFTDSKEHGPEVTQKFGSVGHSINSFLKMMGLGPGEMGGFGGGPDWASMDSAPIARSLDFYPGYGNQAHVDDLEDLDSFDDLPVFHEDITQKFMEKMNMTNSTSTDDLKSEKGGSKKETIKIGMEVKDKSKMSSKAKTTSPKSSSLDGKDVSYASAVPLGKDNESGAKSPLVSYKIPLLRSTVSPRDRKQPVAIYQHSSAGNEDAPKPMAYAPAQAMPQTEGESNPNRLVDDDVVRQWKLINRGQGYVEKRPVPIVDILKTSMHPESLKVLQKVLSDTMKASSNSAKN